MNDDLLELFRKACIADTPVRAPELLAVVQSRSGGNPSVVKFDQNRWDISGYIKCEETRRLASCSFGLGVIPANTLLVEIYPYMTGRIDVWKDFLLDYGENVEKQVRSTVLWFERFYDSPRDKPMVVLSRYLYWEDGVRDYRKVITSHQEAPRLLEKAAVFKKQIYDLATRNWSAPRGIEDERREGAKMVENNVTEQRP